MPSTRSGNPQYYSELDYYYGPRNNPVYNSEYRGRDGSWAYGTMSDSNSHRVRGRPVFLPGPGPERIQFWFYSAGWYIRFNPGPSQRVNTDYGYGIGADMYYYGNSTSGSYPSQFSGVWSTSNVMRWFGGLRYYYFQCHNNVSGYRTILPYRWQINSDQRLKTNIKYLGTNNGHRTYTWEWNELAKSLNVKGPTTGVIAQEVMEYMPEAVTMNMNGYYQVNYGALKLL